MKKLLLLSFIVFLASCNNPVREVVDDIYESIELENDSVELNIGETYQLRLYHKPSTLSSPSCTYFSSSPDIASVNQTGVITALKQGRAKITVTPASELNLEPCECIITVKPILSERITLSETKLNLKIREQKSLTFQIYPSEATNKYVTWESSNIQVATVQYGLVTAIGPGTAIIKAIAMDKASSGECMVTVAPPTVEGVTIESEDKAVVLMVGDTYQLKEKVLPDNAGNKNVTWSIDNSMIASISSTGLVTAKNIGETTAKVTTIDGGFTASIPVKVTDITGSIYAFKNGSATTSINGFVSGNVYSTIINRHKTIVATVTKFEVIDNKTNTVLVSEEDGLGALNPNETMSMTYRLWAVYLPDFTFKWYYTCEGKEYVVSHLYD